VVRTDAIVASDGALPGCRIARAEVRTMTAGKATLLTVAVAAVGDVFATRM
jgi:hypothetical protein